jgi:hypothetical protein
VIPVPLICEIVAPKKTVVRQISFDSLDNNIDLARKAVDRFLNNVFNSAEWTQITASTELSPEEKMEKAITFIKQSLGTGDSAMKESKDSGQIDVLQKEIMRFYRERHARDFSRVHVRYGQEAGLVSKRGTNRFRYAPTDQLLQSLVLANVPDECPLEEFLDKLFSRYGVVIGPRQQQGLEQAGYADFGKMVSSQAFRNNQMRIESRLKSMGMLRRLSDSQAYVLNPLKPDCSK